MHAHHLDGKASGERNLDRIVASCPACNYYVGDPTRGEIVAPVAPLSSTIDPRPRPSTQW
jgi:hypothetical protein